MPVIGEAAPIQQGTNIEEGKCETVRVGQYFCKINGKCYYCDTKTNPDPNKNCYKETTCTAVMTNPALRRPFGGRAPIMRRGVEGETPASEDNKEPSTPPNLEMSAVDKANGMNKIPPAESTRRHI